MKRRSFIIVTSVALLLLVFCVIPCGCADGTLGIKGIAYEWIDAPADATSKIYIEDVVLGREVEPTLERMRENIDSDISTIPLGGAIIAVGPKKGIEKRGEEDYLWKTHSDLEGNVDEFWIIAPGKEQFLVRASKFGYMEVIGEVEHSGVSNLVIIVILVKENDQS